MILVIDNYDSFTFNLVQMVGTIDSDVLVKRNDSFTLDEIKSLNPSNIIISPGPGKPKDAGLCKDLIKYLGKNIPVLGVCLGHQAIGEVFGGKIIQAKNIVQGKVSNYYKEKGINQNYKNLLTWCIMDTFDQLGAQYDQPWTYKKIYSIAKKLNLDSFEIKKATGNGLILNGRAIK